MASRVGVSGLTVTTSTFMISLIALAVAELAVERLADQAQQRTVRHQAHQSMLGVLHRDVADVLPVHDVGGHVDEFVLVHREQVGRHDLFDTQVVLSLIASLGRLGQRPGVGRLAGGFPLQASGNQRRETLGPGGVLTESVVGTDQPLGAGLEALDSSGDDARDSDRCRRRSISSEVSPSRAMGSSSSRISFCAGDLSMATSGPVELGTESEAGGAHEVLSSPARTPFPG